jgi:putative pyruvate formate lyase activating enzyme
VARAAPHFYEEPVISGTRGSGAIFFSGCNMRCVYCQNFPLSRGEAGRTVSTDELSAMMTRLEAAGVHNLNLVTPSHCVRAIIPALRAARPQIPVVYNSSGYDGIPALTAAAPYVDIWLPDFKYAASETARRYSDCPDYPATALRAIEFMLNAHSAKHGCSAPLIEDGIMRAGVIIRHLVLPGLHTESVRAINLLKSEFGNTFLLSLMAQYTPLPACPARELNRRLTRYEYAQALQAARAADLDGFTQTPASARNGYVPVWDM